MPSGAEHLLGRAVGVDVSGIEHGHSCGYGDRTVVESLDLDVLDGRMTAIADDPVAGTPMVVPATP